MKWRVILEFDSGNHGWAVWCPELPGCTSAGDSQAEALENIQAAIMLYLEPTEIRVAPDAIMAEVTV
jgi:predicted RNase H-like HicB family nuclease